MTPTQHKELHAVLGGAVLKAGCREEGALADAGIETARAVLLVTDDENANIQAAISARRLNSNACTAGLTGAIQ